MTKANDLASLLDANGDVVSIIMSGERSPVRMRTVAAHSGAAFEAGQLGHRNGAAPEGTQVVNAREDPDTVRRPADTLLLLGSGDVPGTFRTAGSRRLERVLRTQAVCRSGKLRA